MSCRGLASADRHRWPAFGFSQAAQLGAMVPEISQSGREVGEA